MMWCWPPPPCQTFVLCLFFGTSIYVRRLHKIMWSIMYKFSVLIRLLISLLSLCSFLAYLYLYFFASLSFPFLSCRSFIAFLPFLAFLCLSCFSLCFFWCLFFLIILTFLSFLSFFPFCFFHSRGILKTHDKVLWHLRISVQAPITWHLCSETWHASHKSGMFHSVSPSSELKSGNLLLCMRACFLVPALKDLGAKTTLHQTPTELTRVSVLGIRCLCLCSCACTKNQELFTHEG